MDAQQTILQAFNPNEHLLLELLCQEIQLETLWSISDADYGYRSDVYLKVLERIKREKRIPKMQFDSDLSEVVSLTRWVEPEQTISEYYDQSQRINLKIAFSCTILLTVPEEWYYNREGEKSSVICLIQASCGLSAILPDLWARVGSLLAWRITENGTSSDDLPFFIYGLLLSGLLGELADESELLALTDYLIAAEGRSRADQQGHEALRVQKDWLLGLSSSKLLVDDWRDTAHWLLEESDRIRHPELRSRLLQIAGWLKP